jgi:REP element-mobilizing transposase RayT
MSRPLRLEYPGAVWHVTSRGNEQREIFRDTGDRQKFLSVLGRTVDLFGWNVLAYALMGNHYHLLVETPEPTLSRGMRQLNGVYTQAFNRRHGRVGHLLQGRFKSILVEKESHLLELARYVVLNPVRARLVESAGAWRWTSYRATAGLERNPGWLATSSILRQFGEKPEVSARRYRAFVAEGRGAGYDPWKQVHGQIYLGSREFSKAAARRIGVRRVNLQIPRQQRVPVEIDPRAAALACAKALGMSLEDLKASLRLRIGERRLIAYALRHHGRLTLRQIGEILDVGDSQASALAAAGEDAALKSPALNKRLIGAMGGRGL